MKRVWWETGSSSGGGIGAREKVRWEMGSEDLGLIALGGRAVCCKFGSRLGTPLGVRGNALYVWTWGYLVGEAEGGGVGS